MSPAPGQKLWHLPYVLLPIDEESPARLALNQENTYEECCCVIYTPYLAINSMKEIQPSQHDITFIKYLSDATDESIIVLHHSSTLRKQIMAANNQAIRLTQEDKFSPNISIREILDQTYSLLFSATINNFLP